MFETEPDWIDVFLSNNETSTSELAEINEDWDEFWTHIVKFAKANNITTNYVEEEFVINGELIEASY